MQLATLDLTFSALADPTRRAILNHLSKQEASVLELAKPFDISLPAISKHIRVLENANLVARKKEGRVHKIRLNPVPLENASEWIEYYRVFWQQALSGFQEYIEQPKKRRSASRRA